MDTFRAIAEQLPQLLEQLRVAPPCGRGTNLSIPRAPGVYLLSEQSQPIYVGQTRDLRRRRGQHSRASSRQNQATLAFNLARKAATNRADIDGSGSRADLAADPLFDSLFRTARDRVAAMEFRFVEIREPELRTVFEVYAAVAFGTSEHNSFETH
ncbi:MAG: GIY-YIG nuclease family protein [Candidatus Limnocylindrales bacterium]|jgi:hypothetical protein